MWHAKAAAQNDTTRSSTMVSLFYDNHNDYDSSKFIIYLLLITHDSLLFYFLSIVFAFLCSTKNFAQLHVFCFVQLLY